MKSSEKNCYRCVHLAESIHGEQKLENIENTNEYLIKLVPLLPGGMADRPGWVLGNGTEYMEITNFKKLMLEEIANSRI